MTNRLDERRVALAIVLASVAVFVALYAVQGPVFETPDEAKYVGLGLNILAGRGLVTDFGVPILYHAPIWPLALAIPKAWLGVDPLLVGHLLEALAAIASIVFAAALAWRYRPAAAAVTAAALLATPYLANTARTAGIDLPATAFVLAYVWLALRAIDRGSLRLGLLAGVLFGLGFLMKETVIPFAPIPFLAALLGPARVAVINRVGAASLLTAALASGWWFVLYAQLTGRLYRVGGPAWLLAPIGIVLAVAVVVMLLEPRWSGTARARARRARVDDQRSRRLRVLAAWLGLVAWLLAQLVIYALAPKLGGESIVRIAQLVQDARQYLPVIGMAVGFVVVGSMLALTLARSQPVNELLFASLAQVPLIVLVLGIGETPRHYIATICTGAALGAVGFTAAGARAIEGRGRWLLASAAAIVLLAGAGQLLRARELTIRAPIAVGLGIALIVGVGIVRWLLQRLRASGLPRWSAARTGGAALVGTFLAATLLASVVAGSHARDTIGIARAAAVTEIGDWVRANVPAGSTVVVSPALAYELALDLRTIEVTRIRRELAQSDPDEPLGLKADGGDTAQPLFLGEARHNVDTINLFDAGRLAKRVQALGAVLWIEASYVRLGWTESAIQEALRAAAGATPAATWTYPADTRNLIVVAYRLDPASVAFPTGVTYADPAAIDALADLLGRANAPAAAAAFLDRLAPVPAGPEADAALARLRAVAAP